jgi:LAS superfamily LD-carboxypeptidase LdcB
MFKSSSFLRDVVTKITCLIRQQGIRKYLQGLIIINHKKIPIIINRETFKAIVVIKLLKIIQRGNDGSKQDQNENNETQSDQRKEVPQNDQISQSSDKVVDHSKQDSVSVVGNPTAITVMVNKSNALPKGYRPNDLVRPKVKFTFGSQQLDKALMRAEAADALERMFNQASSNGIPALCCIRFSFL